MNFTKNQNHSFEKLSNSIKILSADAVEKAKSGHPGMPLGFSQIMTILAFNFLKFNPNDPKWFNRDRLVLSAGHGSMLLYSFFYLAGYRNFSLDDIKHFRQLNSKAAGHPESHLYEAIETTTGPLGQGIANAVGMAIAQKKYQSHLGSDICDYNIYAIAGDGCLMEGISYESASLAGHLKLDNLIILFDDNKISIDGKTDLAVSENHLQKFTAMGFETFSVDGYNNQEIIEALSRAKQSDKPCFIACRTIIGKDTKTKENSEKAHGSPLGENEISFLREKHSITSSVFTIDPEIKQEWEQAWTRNKTEYETWLKNYQNLEANKKDYLHKNEINLKNLYQNDSDFTKAEATRVSSGRIIEKLLQTEDKIIVGSADLAGSNGLKHDICRPIDKDDFSGNFIHYGVREHAMAAIMNGLALSGFTTIGGTFLVFADYMRPAMRLAALMQIPAIYVMTHDSIGVGEDGPTHQPIEQIASFRAMPNINTYRPADLNETIECYRIAFSKQNTPAIMALSRQGLPQITQHINQNELAKKIEKGAYLLSALENDGDKTDIAIYASGSEVSLALDVQKILLKKHISSRVISVPCLDIFNQQSENYKKLLKNNARLCIAIEAASEFGWHKIIDSDGLFFGMNSFGASAPAKNLFEYFNLTAEYITESVINRLK